MCDTKPYNYIQTITPSLHILKIMDVYGRWRSRRPGIVGRSGSRGL